MFNKSETKKNPAKEKQGMDTTTPAPEPIKPPEVDTTTPAFGEITPFTAADIPVWGEWLLARIQERWPQWERASLHGRLMGFASSNQFLFVKTGEAVGLAAIAHEPMDSTPFVREVFLFITNPDANKDALKIITEFKRWSQTIRAKRLDLWIASDLARDEVVRHVKGEIYEEVFKDLEVKSITR